MNLKELSKITNIPYMTLSKWNTQNKNNYRKALVDFLKSQDGELLKDAFEKVYIRKQKEKP